ncbi:MAG: M20 family metallopeptidase [Humibacillus sp.]|nr:M20 family metallopeptidase [Humibacillus sp.]MDN5778122.1 M20 family metallopeptidase [Humibacillus sp.]
MSTSVLDLAAPLGPDLALLRRTLHRIPELGLHLPQTQRAVLEALDGLGLDITLGEGLSSVVAVVRGHRPVDGPRPAVLLRGDMDALPVTEEGPADVVSRHVGAMHACGHDLHMAALVGAARILHDLRDQLAGDVVLMFQPGEEGPGGAAPMIAEGLLTASGNRVCAAYALHVFSAEHPVGTWFGRPGPQMAAADEVVVRVVGRGGHGSAPHRTRDPIPVACEMVVALNTIVTRSFDVFDPVVVTVGRIAGGSKENIIPDDVVFEATVRTLSAGSRREIQHRITRLCHGIAEAHGLTVEVGYRLGYPVTRNDPAEFDLARQVVTDLFGVDRWAPMPNPELGSEDMSFVLDEVPGAYLNLSACVGDPAEADDNHSARARFDDAVLADAAAFLAEVAMRRLSLASGRATTPHGEST